VGPDGNLWGGDAQTSGGMWQCTLGGVVTQYLRPGGVNFSGAYASTVGRDNNLWTNTNNNPYNFVQCILGGPQFIHVAMKKHERKLWAPGWTKRDRPFLPAPLGAAA
jgi:hypothetical protein